jgi:asparagine synthase (glutamine-hydrolysing)
MGMANSVEGRFPFLDHRVIELANRLPADFKLLGLTEKWLLRKLASEYLPNEIWKRTKRPYRAPIHKAFFSPGSNSQDYVRELLSPKSINRAGYFNPRSVELLVKKASQAARLAEVDEMALVGILSTQILDDQFVQQQRQIPKPGLDTEIRVVDRRKTTVET